MDSGCLMEYSLARRLGLEAEEADEEEEVVGESEAEDLILLFPITC